MLGEMGELPDIIEAALNHVSIRSALAATYNRSRYRPQVAAALQRLVDALDGIEAGVAKVAPPAGQRLTSGVVRHADQPDPPTDDSPSRALKTGMAQSGRTFV